MRTRFDLLPNRVHIIKKILNYCPVIVQPQFKKKKYSLWVLHFILFQTILFIANNRIKAMLLLLNVIDR
jgi:hypothetical protein